MTERTHQQKRTESIWLCKSEPRRSAAEVRTDAERVPVPDLVKLGRARRALEDRQIDAELGLR